jgi:hypothetical protein
MDGMEAHAEWMKVVDERVSVIAAIDLMKQVCPLKGWCLTGTGADYARRAVERLQDRDRFLLESEEKLQNYIDRPYSGMDCRGTWEYAE